MGGMGSGDWYRWQGKKTTVEESLALAVKDVRKWLHHGASGSLTWTWSSGRASSSVGYFVRWDDAGPVLTLHYRWRDSEDVRVPIRMQTTPTQFGGERWWFTCPLVCRNRVCNGRAGKLYLPPGAKYFGCRKCHDLTYRSSQEAHQARRLFGRLGMPYDPEFDRLLSREHQRSR